MDKVAGDLPGISRPAGGSARRRRASQAVTRSLASRFRLPLPGIVSGASLALMRLSDVDLLDTVVALAKPIFIAHGAVDRILPGATSDMFAQRRDDAICLRTSADDLRSRHEDPARYRGAFRAFVAGLTGWRSEAPGLSTPAPNRWLKPARRTAKSRCERLARAGASPTRSGPEGSSRNEPRLGRCPASHLRLWNGGLMAELAARLRASV